MKLCMYGAGNTGKIFIKKYENILKNKYAEIFFADSNLELAGLEIEGYKVKEPDGIDSDTEIIITTIFWLDVYQTCCRKNYSIRGIYDLNQDKLYTYEEICVERKCTYLNGKYIQHLDLKEKKVEEGIKNFLQTGNLFKNVSEIAFMLSNMCNYAAFHKKCPASCAAKKEILPSKVIFKALDELKLIEFDGVICFHVYNEPLIDPRLFWLIEYIKKNLMSAKTEIYSNGYYLNEQMINELENVGADILLVTGYGEQEFERLINLKTDMAYCVQFGNLDERLDMYKDREKPISADPCKTYFTQVSIYSDGEVGTCCLDYRHPYKLANIYNMSLEEALNSEKMISIQKRLLEGDRSLFPICKNCSWNR